MQRSQPRRRWESFELQQRFSRSNLRGYRISHLSDLHCTLRPRSWSCDYPDYTHSRHQCKRSLCMQPRSCQLSLSSSLDTSEIDLTIEVLDLAIVRSCSCRPVNVTDLGEDGSRSWNISRQIGGRTFYCCSARSSGW